MFKSDTISKIAPAILAAQKEIGLAKKSEVNPYFKSHYASLVDVIATVKEALNKNGIAVIQPINGDTVETYLLHESGEWVGSSMTVAIAKPNDPQALGSAVSYAKRQSLQALALVGTEDDDAELAMERTKPSEPVKAAPAKEKVEQPETEFLETITRVDAEELVSKAGKKFKKYSIYTSEGTILSTIDGKMAAVAIAARDLNHHVRLKWESTKWGPQLKAIALAPHPKEDDAIEPAGVAQ